jgi:hypothetical protein
VNFRRGGALPDVGFIEVNPPVTFNYDTFSNTTPAQQFLMNWAPNPQVTGNYIGGCLQTAAVFDISTALFIPAIFSDTNRYNVGLAPGFSAITFINELSVVANDGNFNLPSGLVINVGMVHERNTSGTSTTPGTTGMNFSPQSRTLVSGAVMTKTDQTGLRISPTWSTVAGSTANLGTIRGMHCFNPAVGIFQPGAGIETMTAYYGLDMNNITFGGTATVAAVRSALAPGTNQYFLLNNGNAVSDFGIGHIYFDDNAGVAYGGVGVTTFDFWSSWNATGYFRQFFLATASSLRWSSPVANRFLFDSDGGSVDGEYNFNCAKFSMGAQTGAVGNQVGVFAAGTRSTQLGGEWADFLLTQAANITVDHAMGAVMGWAINSPSITIGTGSVTDTYGLSVGGSASGGSVNRAGVRILSNPSGGSGVNAALWLTDGTLVIGDDTNGAEFGPHDLTDFITTFSGTTDWEIFGLNSIVLNSTFQMAEQAANNSPAAGFGEFWVRNDIPNVPMFTDDAGTDFVLNAGGGGSPFATPLAILGDTDGAPPVGLICELQFWDQDQSDLLADLGFTSNTADFHIRNKNHGGVVYIEAEDSAGTTRNILQANPDNITILRADTNLQLECAAGAVALTAIAGAQLELRHNGIRTFQTQLLTSGGGRLWNSYSGQTTNYERILTSSDIVKQVTPLWEFSSGTGGGGPSAGHFAFDSGTLGSITECEFDDQAIYGNTTDDFGNFYSELSAGDILYFRGEVDETSLLLMIVDGVAVDDTGYWTIPMSYISGTLPNNNERYSMQVQFLSQASGGGVGVSGTPTNDQIAVWTNATTIEGAVGFEWNNLNLNISTVGGVMLELQDNNTTGAGAAASIAFLDQVGTTQGAIGTLPIVNTLLVSAEGTMLISAGNGTDVISVSGYLQPMLATDAELDDITDAINTDPGKRQGSMIYNSSQDIPVWAVGNADGDLWVDGTGATVNTPV